jgi:hypothetical protein
VELTGIGLGRNLAALNRRLNLFYEKGVAQPLQKLRRELACNPLGFSLG